MEKPKLQLALDYVSLKEPLEMVEKVESEVDLIEAGTPLIKAVGMQSILKGLSEVTKKPIVADLKAADVADIEFQVAKEYGATYVTMLGASPIENIEDGLKFAKENNLKAVVDLIGVKDYIEMSKKLIDMGVELLGVHCGISEQRQGKTTFSKTREISEAINDLGGRLVVAGGIKQDNVNELEGIENIEIVIVGGGITSADNPYDAAKSIKESINKL
ncbi:MAG: orotidine 5'-phosphate decarboxylase [Parcubacteria group bacterium]|nr:orotidine 5'-phosphate decarboxylase [Parcubacteria group bacterium]